MGAASASYYHTDMLGTTRYMSTPDDGQGGGGLGTDGVTYTAFGERICTLDDSCGPADPNPRYGYAGAWGYRAQDSAEDPGSHPVPFLHVGHRYYDPAIGRFLQRDPIAIDGGLNVYQYVESSPINFVDPLGLAKHKSFWPPNKGRFRYGPSKVKTGYRRWGTRYAFRYGSAHVYGMRGAAIFGACAVGAAAVGTAAGLAIDHFVVEPRQEDNFDRNAQSQDGSMSPYDEEDPWGWVQPGSSWEAQRDRWRAENGS